ncbi:hypothetical protein Cgig2_019816 [Carnegiea gigantea]|uniref:DUF4283 domain-containing protein n=1 Tax=Carnegiea gigantea TaxID=171969 RepID=A0A9Q1Q9A4_9CARY|nr:hypothetical protein Cgig2_019816 [Carnegiea gigantea]
MISPVFPDKVAEPHNVIPPIKSSYAALVNPNEGTSLSFIVAPTINGKKCPKLEPEDVTPEVVFRQSAVLCMVLQANPPLEVIDGFIRRIWGNYFRDKVCLVRPGLFLVRFDQNNEQQEVTSKGVFCFNRKPFIVKPWNAEMEINTEEIESLPGVTSLSKIGSLIGISIKTDRYTKEKSMLRYARMLIDFPLKEEFPEYIEFANDKDVLIRQSVLYEWQPIKCKHCHTYGHLEDQCSKKQAPRKV